MDRTSARWLANQWAVPSILLLAVVVGAAVRFFHLGGVPPALQQDEAVNGYDAYSLWLTGRDHLGHPFPFAGLESFGDWASPLLTFLTVPVVGLSGLSVVSVRVVPAIVGLCAVPLAYLLAMVLFRRPLAGLVAAWYMALDPWAVHLSRYAIPPAIVPTMLLLTLVTLVWSLDTVSGRGIVWASLVAALTIASYPIMKLYVPLLLLAVLAIYHRAVLRLPREAICYGVAIFLVVAGPVLYLSVRDPGGRARFDQVSAAKSPDFSLLFMVRQYESYFSPHTFFISGNGNPGQTPTPPGRGILPWAALPFLVLGGVALIRRVWSSETTDRRSALLVLSALALYPIPGALTIPNYAPFRGADLSRATHLIPLLAIVTGFGAATAFDLARALVARARTVGLGLVRIVAVALGVFWVQDLRTRYDYYFNQYPRSPSVLNYYQYGVEQALTYVRRHAAEVRTIWITPYNQPYIYVLFFARWPPNDVHAHLQVIRHPPRFNTVTQWHEYHFDSPANVQPAALRLRYTVRDPLGRAVYEVRQGYTARLGRFIWVRKP